MRSWGWDPHDGISTLKRRDTRELFISLCHARPQQEGSHLQAKKRVLTMILDPDLKLLVSITVRKKCLLFKPLRIWYFVIAAQTDKDKEYIHLINIFKDLSFDLI